MCCFLLIYVCLFRRKIFLHMIMFSKTQCSLWNSYFCNLDCELLCTVYLSDLYFYFTKTSFEEVTKHCLYNLMPPVLSMNDINIASLNCRGLYGSKNEWIKKRKKKTSIFIVCYNIIIITISYHIIYGVIHIYLLYLRSLIQLVCVFPV